MDVNSRKNCSFGKRMLFPLLLAAMLIVSATSAFAQTHRVQGTVKDAQGEPMIGVVVVVVNTSQYSVTDMDGKYSFNNLKESDIIRFTSMSYEPTEVTVGRQQVIDVTMQEASTQLDELIVVGYGSLSKKEVSSSIVSVSSEQFNKGATRDPMELLVGKVAGLNIDVSSGSSPHSTSSYQIRGATSLNGGNTPLIVIDGMAGASMDNLSNQDIESISVLKDGASAAIYGTRGANGVILITTKRGSGEEGRFTTRYEGYFAINALHKLPETYELDEWLKLGRGTDFGGRDDWRGELTRDLSYDHNEYVSIAGSTQKSNYNLSLNYIDRTGLDIANDRQEYGGRFQLNQKAFNGVLEINTVANIRATNSKNGSSGITGTVTMNPTLPIWNEDGTYYHPTTSTGATNSVETANDVTVGNNGTALVGQVELKLNLIKSAVHSLNTSANVSVNYNENKYSYYLPSTHATSAWNSYDGSATLSHNKSWMKNFEWLVNYVLSAEKHTLKAVAGYSFTENFSESMSMTNYDFDQDSFLYNDIGSGRYLANGEASMSSGKSSSRLVGVFARINYSWNDLLSATVSARYEGSTKFGIGKKWGMFPSASASWEIANMPFMSGIKNTVRSLKMRASYGVTGRNAGSNYASLATYSSKGSAYLLNGEWISGYGVTRNANPNLMWETAVVFDAGFDFEITNRLSGSIEYFDRRSNDLLYTYTAPQPPYIYSSIQLNLGSTKNTGFELALNYRAIQKKDFKLTLDGTYAYGKAWLTSIGNDVYKASYIDLYSRGGLGNADYYFRLENGTRLGEMYGYRHAGVDENGELLVYAADGSEVTKTNAEPDDKVYIGNTMPKHVFSLNLNFNYKNWDLTINGRGAAGMMIWNNQLMSYGLQGLATENVLKTAYTKYGHITSDGSMVTSFFLQKGDWFKIERVTLGYNFNIKKNKAGISDLYVYGAATNLHTFTGFEGVDPSTVTSIGLTPGISGSTVLYTSKITLGLRLNF